MPKSSVTAVTSLGNYVKKYHSQLGKIFDQCDLWQIIGASLKNKLGVTLIVPSSTTITEMDKDIDISDKICDVCTYLLAHVIRGAYHTASDWASSAPIDMRIPAQRLNVSVSGDKVRLQTPNGATYATLERAADFVPTFRTNIAVWKVTDGAMNKEANSPASTDEMSALFRRNRHHGPDAETSGEKKRGKGKRGGYELHTNHMQSARFQVAMTAENDFAVCAQLRQKPELAPHLAYVISFANYVMKSNSELFFSAVLPLIRFRHTDLYAIFESHRELSEEQYLIPDHLIASWFREYNPREATVQNMMQFRDQIDNFIATAKGSSSSCAAYDNAIGVISAIDNLRMQIMEHASSGPMIASAIGTMRERYRESAIQNRVGNIPNLFPPALAQHFKENPYLKMIHDEIAYSCEPIFQALWSSFDESKYITLINMIGTTYHTDPRQVLTIMPLTGTRRFELMFLSARNEAYADEIRAFINSTQFMWIPLTKELRENYPIKSVAEHPHTAQLDVLYNADQELALKHQRLYSRMNSQTDSALIQAILRNVSSSALSQEAREQITRLAGEIGAPQ